MDLIWNQEPEAADQQQGWIRWRSTEEAVRKPPPSLVSVPLFVFSFYFVRLSVCLKRFLSRVLVCLLCLPDDCLIICTCSHLSVCLLSQHSECFCSPVSGCDVVSSPALQCSCKFIFCIFSPPLLFLDFDFSFHLVLNPPPTQSLSLLLAPASFLDCDKWRCENNINNDKFYSPRKLKISPKINRSEEKANKWSVSRSGL